MILCSYEGLSDRAHTIPPVDWSTGSFNTPLRLVSSQQSPQQASSSFFLYPNTQTFILLCKLLAATRNALSLWHNQPLACLCLQNCRSQCSYLKNINTHILSFKRKIQDILIHCWHRWIIGSHCGQGIMSAVLLEPFDRLRARRNGVHAPPIEK